MYKGQGGPELEVPGVRLRLCAGWSDGSLTDRWKEACAAAGPGQPDLRAASCACRWVSSRLAGSTTHPTSLFTEK